MIKVCCRRNYSSLRARLRTGGCWVTGGQSEASTEDGSQSEAGIVSPGMIQCTMELPLVTSVLRPEPDTDQYKLGSLASGHNTGLWLVTQLQFRPLIGHQPLSACSRGQWGHPGTWTVTRLRPGWAAEAGARHWAASVTCRLWQNNGQAGAELDIWRPGLNGQHSVMMWYHHGCNLLFTTNRIQLSQN